MPRNRFRAAAANLVYEVVPRFVGDPAGAAMTNGILRAYVRGLNGRSGFVQAGDKFSTHAFKGSLPHNPQRGLEATATTGLINNLYYNGPNQLTNAVSAETGKILLDARMRALANQVGR